MKVEIPKEKLIWFENWAGPAHGSHQPQKAPTQLCINEAVAFLAGEGWSDNPACVSPAVRRFSMRLNDDWDDERRKKLKPYALRMLGTRTTDTDEIKRGYIAADYAVRVAIPFRLDIRGKTEWADKFRALAPLIDEASAIAARDFAREARDALWAEREAARKKADAYAYADAAYAADAAAYAAYAAYAYAYAAAYAADAADAAAAAAYPNQRKITVEQCDAAALACLSRMIEVGRE